MNKRGRENVSVMLHEILLLCSFLFLFHCIVDINEYGSRRNKGFIKRNGEGCACLVSVALLPSFCSCLFGHGD